MSGTPLRLQRIRWAAARFAKRQTKGMPGRPRAGFNFDAPKYGEWDDAQFALVYSPTCLRRFSP
jgi:hypothetical protein